MKICIFGGSFDPVHNGHLHLIRQIGVGLTIDKFIIVPANISPLKLNFDMADNHHRVNMLKLALKDYYPYCVVDEYELDMGGYSYTIDTIEKLKLKYGKDNEYYFLIGSDNIRIIKMWKEYKKLLKLAKFIVVPRDNFKIDQIEEDVMDEIQLVFIEEIDVSSTKIRNAIKRNKSISKFVPASIEKYINKNNLYKQIL